MLHHFLALLLHLRQLLLELLDGAQVLINIMFQLELDLFTLKIVVVQCFNLTLQLLLRLFVEHAVVLEITDFFGFLLELELERIYLSLLFFGLFGL